MRGSLIVGILSVAYGLASVFGGAAMSRRPDRKVPSMVPGPLCVIRRRSLYRRRAAHSQSGQGGGPRVCGPGLPFDSGRLQRPGDARARKPGPSDYADSHFRLDNRARPFQLGR